jgi:hypothetical protein
MPGGSPVWQLCFLLTFCKKISNIRGFNMLYLYLAAI